MPPGLRERKRAQTRERLERAAVDLVLRDGLDAVTVDAISEAADVATRTFFNYFDSKEDAILGVRPASVGAFEVAAYLTDHARTDLVDAIVGLVLTVVGPSISDPAFGEARVQILRTHPQLLERQLARSARLTEQLTAGIRALVAESRGAGAADGTGTPPSDALAETMLMACGGAVRAAARQWAATDSDISLDDLQTRAVTLAREAADQLR
ncbi:MAG: hypothetical protein JWP95_2065 [Actinotalea sp.]|nr:hypothetical protein [Actinotalea sp.]